MTRALLLLAACVVLGSNNAAAQLSFGDQDQPILVKADKATYKGTLTILEGNVDVRQGDAKINSDKMEIYRVRKDTTGPGLSLGAVTRIVATGNFRYTTPEDVVTGTKGVYVRKSETIVVTGNVSVGQPGRGRLSGERLVYDLRSKRAKVGNDSDRVNFSINQREE